MEREKNVRTVDGMVYSAKVLSTVYGDRIIKFKLSDFIDVDSTRIMSYLYQGGNKSQLLIRFVKPSDIVYIYCDIDQNMFDDFVNSESKGKFLARIIANASETYKCKIS